jgi:hypothetical protein
MKKVEWSEVGKVFFRFSDKRFSFFFSLLRITFTFLSGSGCRGEQNEKSYHGIEVESKKEIMDTY